MVDVVCGWLCTNVVARNVGLHRAEWASKTSWGCVDDGGCRWRRAVEVRGGAWECMDGQFRGHTWIHKWTSKESLSWSPMSHTCGRPLSWSLLDVHVCSGWMPNAHSCWASRPCGHGHTKWVRPRSYVHAQSRGYTHFAHLLDHETFHAPASPRAPSFSKFSLFKCLTF